jgi:hypothetical protein
MRTGAWAGYFLASETWSLLSLVGRFSRPDMSACANIVSDMIVKSLSVDVMSCVMCRGMQVCRRRSRVSSHPRILMSVRASTSWMLLPLSFLCDFLLHSPSIHNHHVDAIQSRTAADGQSSAQHHLRRSCRRNLRQTSPSRISQLPPTLSERLL